MKTSNFITYDKYIENKKKRIKTFYYVNDIKHTLTKLNLVDLKSTKYKKKELETKLFTFYDNLKYYNSNIDKIVRLQRAIKIKLNSKKDELYGPSINDRSISHNDTDFYSFEEIINIHKEYLFSYEENGFVYSFDIRSFLKLLDSTSENPYNRQKIPDYVIKIFNKRVEYIKKNNIYIEPYEEDKLTPEQVFNNRVFHIFQTIDLLNASAGGTNPQWFHNLSLIQLKNYYKVLEDIWNYRAELSSEQKKDIVKNKNMFKYSVSQIFTFNNKRKIQEIILTEIEKLLFTSESDIHRSTACYYVLIAFVEISQECLEAMPWLIQY